jgi:serine protease Do
MKKCFIIVITAMVFFVSTDAFADIAEASWFSSDSKRIDEIATVKSDKVLPAAWLETRPASFADLAEKVQDAVVNISTTKKVRQPQFMTPFPRFGPRDPFDEFFEKFFEGVPKERTQRSLGSGFIVSKDGFILTNNHVVSQADEIMVELSDGRKFKAKVAGKDERTDLALIRIKDHGELPYVKLGDSDKLRAGDWVMAIGNPFGLEHTVTVGVVSAKGRLLGGGGPYARFIQTDASINPGNSGGPLFSLKGEVVGVNTMIYAGGQGIGFAIPINLAKDLMPQLMTKGSVTRGWLGVAIQPITPELAKSFGLKDEKGALIAQVYQGSPADEAGFKSGDVVVEFEGKKIEEPYDLSMRVGRTKVGEKVKVKVLRKGEEETLKVKIGKVDSDKFSGVAKGDWDEDRGKADALGLVVRQLSLSDKRQLDLPQNFEGVVATRVEPHSSAEMSDIRSGDIVREINGKTVKTVEDYKKATKSFKKGDYARLLIKRGSANIYLAFQIK